MNSVGNLVLVQLQGAALGLLAQLLANEVLALGNNLAVLLALAVAGNLAGEAALGENTLAALSNFLHSLHGLDGGGDQVAVVLDGDVALLGELRKDEGRVDDHFLATSGTVALRPLQLAWLALHLEVLVALGPTESELSGVIADECDSLAREGGTRTKVASLHARDKSKY